MTLSKPTRSGGEPPKKRSSAKPQKAEMQQRQRRSTEDSVSMRLAHRAYDIYMERMSRGPLDDWLEAEREMLSREPPE